MKIRCFKLTPLECALFFSQKLSPPSSPWEHTFWKIPSSSMLRPCFLSYSISHKVFMQHRLDLAEDIYLSQIEVHIGNSHSKSNSKNIVLLQNLLPWKNIVLFDETFNWIKLRETSVFSTECFAKKKFQLCFRLQPKKENKNEKNTILVSRKCDNC